MRKLSVFSYQCSVAEKQPLKSRLITDHRSLITSTPGFTILELVTVMLIIGVLSGLVLGITKYAVLKGAISRAQAEIAAMENALESYKIDNGVYPQTSTVRDSGYGAYPTAIEINNSGVLYTALAGGTKQYYTFKPNQITISGGITYIVDPFGSPYNYFCNPNFTGNPQANQATFDLWSYGPARTNERPREIYNDIVNWRR